MADRIKPLIINSPYDEPQQHWKAVSAGGFERASGRRKAGYLIAKGEEGSSGEYHEIPLVNEKIRPRVKKWREDGYPGVSAITRRLLEYWKDIERRSEHRLLFFCQIEAAETMIWLKESPAVARAGVDIPSDGAPEAERFPRFCAKMATGTGKTVVMGMMIAWHILNKMKAPQDTRFSKEVLVVAPGLTVKDRLRVLQPDDPNSCYRVFDLIPAGLQETLRQGRVLVRNWQALDWETQERQARKRGVDRRGAKSDEAYVREILGELHRARRLLVINDEAHHAWREPGPDIRVRKLPKEEKERATKWVGGLGRIHRARGIVDCLDFSATPFIPSGGVSIKENLFPWIVSDFGLADAIESGLVKTPKVVIADDAKSDSSAGAPSFHHLYGDPEVKDDLNRKAPKEAGLPDPVRNAYRWLANDWLSTYRDWKAKGFKTPPVMITVANRTETAARVHDFFEKDRLGIEELSDPEHILHIDSRVLEQAEGDESVLLGEAGVDRSSSTDSSAADGARFFSRKKSKKDRAQALREKVYSVGKEGRSGEGVRKVISVGMLSEGWDAKSVTHIMGLRAFSSQLLCEQVVGRGLRRTSYDLNSENLLDPEYVKVCGVPFAFLRHEAEERSDGEPQAQSLAVHPLPERRALEIRFPVVARIEYGTRSDLFVDWSEVDPLILDAGEIPEIISLAPVVAGEADLSNIERVDIEALVGGMRRQTIVFDVAREVFESEGERCGWKGNPALLMAQIVHLIEEFIASDRIAVKPHFFAQDKERRNLVISLQMTRIVRHFSWAIRFRQGVDEPEAILDSEQPFRSTSMMDTWHTRREVRETTKSHINLCVLDSGRERSDARALEEHPQVEAWVKNDHLGFEIPYDDRGVVRLYRPDFIIRFRSGRMLVLETKGEERERDRIKWVFMKEWVRAVNACGEFGRWSFDVTRGPEEIPDILDRHSSYEGFSNARIDDENG
ncbi:MAG: DEAD/DEAH box helicase family protein [Ectothiorhodospiraceae bacterium AqS1]|nr:DEAD/DEAH box helicase family protein [Ectothiorhodospiraceae bacterium AqS1]